MQVFERIARALNPKGARILNGYIATHGKKIWLLATLLAMAFGKRLFTKTKNVAKDRNHLTETKFP